jgi:hypothetical protein
VLPCRAATDWASQVYIMQDTSGSFSTTHEEMAISKETD